MTTGAGQLPARFVIHTVGPVYQDGAHDEDHVLANGAAKNFRSPRRNRTTHECRIRSAFPAISTGVYHYPPDEAAMVAVSAVIEYFDEHHESGIKHA